MSPAADDDRALYGRVMARILPIVVFAYFVGYVDRINISFLKLRMLDDLGLSETAYAFGAGVFFWGYLIFQAPLTLLVARVGARRGIAALALVWGVISCLMVFIDSAAGFYVLRFLLGVSEAAFFPAVLLYFTQWFPATRQARIMSFLFLATPLGVVFGGPAIGWFMDRMDGVAGLAGWRWSFLLSAAPSLAAAVLVAFLLQDGPNDARWLDAGARRRLIENLDRDAAGKSSDLKAALRSPLLWLLALICFLYNIGHYGLLFWTPTIIKAFGLASTFHVGLLSAIPYAAAMLSMILVAASAERSRERRLHAAIPILVAGAALAISSLTADHLPLSLAFLTVSVAGLMTTLALFWSIPGSLLAGSAAAGGVAFINTAAVIAGMVGPALVGLLKDATGGTQAGVVALGFVLAAAGLLILAIPRAVMARIA